MKQNIKFNNFTNDNKDVNGIQNTNNSEKPTIKILVVIGNTGTTTKKLKNPNGTTSYSGFPWDLWKKIEEKIEHKYNFEYFNSDETGDGSTNYNKFCELVNKGKYDIVLGTFHYTEYREKLINYTNPINIDFSSIIHYPQTTLIGSIRKILYPISKLIIILVILGILFGIILSKIDKKRNNKKGAGYVLRVVLTTVASMFGEMGFLTENSSITARAMISVLLIMVIAFILITFVQAEILKNLLRDDSGKITFDNIGKKRLIGFEGYATVVKLKRYNQNFTLFDFKKNKDKKKKNDKTNKMDDTEKLLKMYMDNTDKYDGVALAYCRTDPYLKKYPKLIASNFGNEPCSYVVNFKNTKFLKDVNYSIMVLKNNLELKRICNSYYNVEEGSSVCSLT